MGQKGVHTWGTMHPLTAFQTVLPLGFLRLDAGRFEPIPDGIRADAQFFRHLPHGATFLGHQPDCTFLECCIIAWRRFVFSFFHSEPSVFFLFYHILFCLSNRVWGHEENKRRQEIQKRLDDLVKLMQKIYEDRVLGNMPDKACAELLDSYQNEKEVLQAELNELKKRADGYKREADGYKREEDDVDEFIRRLKSYAGAEELTRQMCLELIEYVTIDKYVDKHTQRDVHIYYKLIDKPLRDKTNALA